MWYPPPPFGPPPGPPPPWHHHGPPPGHHHGPPPGPPPHIRESEQQLEKIAENIGVVEKIDDPTLAKLATHDTFWQYSHFIRAINKSTPRQIAIVKRIVRKVSEVAKGNVGVLLIGIDIKGATPEDYFDIFSIVNCPVVNSIKNTYNEMKRTCDEMKKGRG